jgi:hypothetical protein
VKPLQDLAFRVAESECELATADVDSEEKQGKTLCISGVSEVF